MIVMEIEKTRQNEPVDPETGEMTNKAIIPQWMMNEFELLKRQRFISGTSHEERVKKSLALGGNSRDFEVSLLLCDNQEAYASEANHLFQKKFRNITRNEKAIAAKFRKIKGNFKNHYPTDDHSIAQKRLRFGTIIHSVTGLNVKDALDDAYQLKIEVPKCVKKCPGLTFYGVLEAEVISYRNMVRNQEYESRNIDETDDLEKEKNYIKLINTRELGQHLGESVLNGEDGQICIHLHVLLVAKNESIFKKFQSILQETNLWNSGTRRIQIKTFRERFNDKNKPVTFSLKDMARYMSKGGTIIHDRLPALKYKINAPNDKLTTYDEFLEAQSLYDEDGLFDEYHEGKVRTKKFTTDFLSLSPLEINVLHEVNEGMMNFDESRTGHIIKLGHW